MRRRRFIPADRRARRLRAAAVIGIGTLALGSCGGAMLTHYTLSGVNPFWGERRDQAWTTTRNLPDEGIVKDWHIIDARLEAERARHGSDFARWSPPS